MLSEPSFLHSSHSSPIKSNTTSAELNATKMKFKKQIKIIDRKYSRKYKEQAKKIKCQSKEIRKLMLTMKYMKRRLDESDIKYRELSLQLKSGSTEKTPSTATGSKASDTEANRPQNIKPRAANINLKKRRLN